MVDIKFIHGDCLEEMPKLADKSIDMILCDLPYQTTACKWDVLIPFEPLWKQYKRLIKDNGAIVLTASQPFTSALVMSNSTMFKHEWIWHKDKPNNFATAKYAPMKYHESIIVFCISSPRYTPIMIARTGSGAKRCKTVINYKKGVSGGSHIKSTKDLTIRYNPQEKYPSTVLYFDTGRRQDYIHPTQKPVALFEYLIRTYTNEGDTVLDNCSGSGTTGIAAFNTKRNAILIEKDEIYFNAAKERFDRETRQVAMW